MSFIFLVDIWSVGCIMAELITGKTLFPGDDRIFSCFMDFLSFFISFFYCILLINNLTVTILFYHQLVIERHFK